MRVLTVGNMYPPLSLGGYEVAWKSSVEHLRASGHEVRVLTSDYESSQAPASEPSVFRELRWYWRDYEFPRLDLAGRIGLERYNARVLAGHLADMRPDVVAWWAMGGMSLSLLEAARRRGQATCAVVCDEWPLYAPQVDQWTRIFRGWRAALAPLFGRLAGAPAEVHLERIGPTLFLSEHLRRRIADAGIAIPVSVVQHRGIEADLFPASEPSAWQWRLLYVGRIDPRKGVDLAVEALALLPAEATLRIDGEGEERYVAELRRLADERGVGDRITIDRRRRADLAHTYAGSDAVLFPTRWAEPWGLVPLEAMSVGRPVIASGRGGSAEYLENLENCLIVEVDDGPEALAKAVRRLSGDPDLRASLRAGGRATAERIRLDDFNEAVERLLNQAREAGPPPT